MKQTDTQAPAATSPPLGQRQEGPTPHPAPSPERSPSPPEAKSLPQPGEGWPEPPAPSESSRREESGPAPRNVASARPIRRLANIRLDLIDPDPHQVRGHNDLEAEAFNEMCANVGQYGVLQPPLVRPSTTPGRYTLIAGEFRYEAARATGHTTLPCYVEESSLDQTAIVLCQLSENLHRRQLPHLDLARAFHRLTLPRDEGGGGLKAKELARRLGKSEAFISEHRSLLELSAVDQQRLEAGTLSFDQARAKVRGRAAPRRRAGDRSARGGTCPTPNALPNLENGRHVYAQYSRIHGDTNLAVLVAGSAQTAPPLECAVRAVERHLHFLKLKLSRESRLGAGKPP
jgi:ParB/RepB/Spo0J family partition protein